MTVAALFNPFATSRRARLTAALGALIALGLTAACASPLGTRSADVQVVDPQGRPIAGAVVRADPIDPRHPLSIADYLRSEPGTLGVWRTDASGQAAILLLEDRPTAVSFLAAGYTPDSLVIAPSSPPPLRLNLRPVSAGTRNP